MKRLKHFLLLNSVIFFLQAILMFFLSEYCVTNFYLSGVSVGGKSNYLFHAIVLLIAIVSLLFVILRRKRRQYQFTRFEFIFLFILKIFAIISCCLLLVYFSIIFIKYMGMSIIFTPIIHITCTVLCLPFIVLNFIYLVLNIFIILEKEEIKEDENISA